MKVKTTPVKLGDILQIERIPVEVDLEKPYIQIGIRSFGHGIFHRDPIPGKELSKLRYFEIRPGRLIVSNIMAWEGAVAVSSASDTGCIGSNRFLSYVPTGDVDLAYLNYFFQGEIGRKLISKTSTGTVTRNQTLSINDFEGLEVALPGLTEQRRIAMRLDSVASSLGTIKQAREHTLRRLRYIRHSLLSSIDTHRLLADALSVSSASTDVTSSAKYEIVGMYSFGKGFIRRVPITGSETKYHRFTPIKAGQVVMSKLNAWEGALAVVDQQFDGCHVSPEYPVFDLDTTVALPGYIKHLVAWPTLWERLRPRGSMVRRKRTHPDVLLALSVPLPDIPDQIEISWRLDQLASAETLTVHQGQLMDALRTTTVNEAFSSCQ